MTSQSTWPSGPPTNHCRPHPRRLGCVHDGSPPPSYLGGPGATHCPWEDGFIMSDLRHTERGFRWSQCSVDQFKHFLNGETATCLYNYPHESQMLHRLLPGTMLSLDEQCKRDRGTNACFKDARVCAQLFCFDSASGYCVSYRPAAEGSPCGEGQVSVKLSLFDCTNKLNLLLLLRPPRCPLILLLLLCSCRRHRGNRHPGRHERRLLFHFSSKISHPTSPGRFTVVG